MPCPECEGNSQRAVRAEAAERSLLLFTETFSKLARQLWDIEQETMRRRQERRPPPEGAAPIKKHRYLLVRAESLEGGNEAAENARDAPLAKKGSRRSASA